MAALIPRVARSPVRNSDEGIYAAQAWAVHARGTLSPWPYWYDHPPLGWILLGGWNRVEHATGLASSGLASARHAAVVCAATSAALLFLLARRLRFPPAVGWIAATLFVASPLAFQQLRQGFLDTLALPFVLGASLTAAGGADRRRMVLAGALLGTAGLIKETTLLLLPVVALFAVTAPGRTGTIEAGPSPESGWRASLVPLLGTALAVFALYPLLAVVRSEVITLSAGEGPSLLRGVHFQLVGRQDSGSILDAGSPRRQLIRQWLSMDPWLVALGLAAVPVGLASRRLRACSLAAVIAVAGVVRPGYVPAMFLIVFLPFLALLVAGSAHLGIRRAHGRRRRAAGLAAGAALVALLAGWISNDVALVRGDGERTYRAAVAWLERNVERDRTLLVDGGVWLDVVEAGFAPERVLATREFDGDIPARATTPTLLPPGSVILVTPPVRRALDRVARRPGDRPLERTGEAIEHARVVATFGSAANAIVVRVASRTADAGAGGGDRP